MAVSSVGLRKASMVRKRTSDSVPPKTQLLEQKKRDINSSQVDTPAGSPVISSTCPSKTKQMKRDPGLESEWNMLVKDKENVTVVDNIAFQSFKTLNDLMAVCAITYGLPNQQETQLRVVKRKEELLLRDSSEQSQLEDSHTQKYEAPVSKNPNSFGVDALRGSHGCSSSSEAVADRGAALMTVEFGINGHMSKTVVERMDSNICSSRSKLSCTSGASTSCDKCGTIPTAQTSCLPSSIFRVTHPVCGAGPSRHGGSSTQGGPAGQLPTLNIHLETHQHNHIHPHPHLHRHPHHVQGLDPNSIPDCSMMCSRGFIYPCYQNNCYSYYPPVGPSLGHVQKPTLGPRSSWHMSIARMIIQAKTDCDARLRCSPWPDVDQTSVGHAFRSVTSRAHSSAGAERLPHNPLTTQFQSQPAWHRLGASRYPAPSSPVAQPLFSPDVLSRPGPTTSRTSLLTWPPSVSRPTNPAGTHDHASGGQSCHPIGLTGLPVFAPDAAGLRRVQERPGTHHRSPSLALSGANRWTKL